ncbi:hypothetical protein Acr_07g0017560 [Actinidia rufa]|uniref:Uncharacterized protein n=1 Tax=Actinidia rufa TaxID=165716 RepID=A0A7J0EYR7_9ERIC|nr:hypothetical protein Acr_07g0017560 [Actinidia rufa]
MTMVNNCRRTHKVVELLVTSQPIAIPFPTELTIEDNPDLEKRPKERTLILAAQVPQVHRVVRIDLRGVGEEEDDDDEVNQFGSSSEKEVDMAPKQQALGKEKAAKGEPQRQVPNPIPIIPCPVEVQLDIPSSHSSGCLRTSDTPELWSPKFSTIELGRELTSADSSKDHETCLALRKAIMLPQDVTEFAEEDSEGFRGRLVMMGAQLFALKNTAIHARDEAEAAIEEKNKALQEVTELWKVASSEIFKKVFDCRSSRLLLTILPRMPQLHQSSPRIHQRFISDLAP